MDESIVEETTVTREAPTGAVATSRVRQVSGNPYEFYVSKTNQVIFAVIAIINLLILLRFVFLLFGANRVGIVSSLISFTNIFVSPFQGIFPAPTSGEAYFETASILAILIWTVIGFILSTIVKMFSTRTPEAV